MKKNRCFLPLLIILLVIFVPLTCVIGYNKYMDSKKEENPEHLPFYDGKLYFYDASNSFIGTYPCSSDNCKILTADTKDEYEYFDYSSDELGVLGGNVVLVSDNEEYILYNLKSNIKIGNFFVVKNYDKESKTVIVKNQTGNEGVLSTENISFIIPVDYKYIGKTSLKENKYVVLSDLGWSIIDNSNNKITSDFIEPIYYYDDKFIYTTVDNIYKVYDYEGNALLENELINQIDRYNDNFIVLTNGKINIYTINGDLIKTFSSYNSNYNYHIKENILEISNEDGVITSYNLDLEEE